MRRLMSVMVLSLGLLVSTAGLAAPPAADNLVAPGVSLGKIKIGMAKEEVRKTLGKPQDTFKLESKVEADVWRSKNVVQVFYKGGKVVQIAASGPQFKTADELSSKTKADDVNKRFPDLEEVRLRAACELDLPVTHPRDPSADPRIDFGCQDPFDAAHAPRQISHFGHLPLLFAVA